MSPAQQGTSVYLPAWTLTGRQAICRAITLQFLYQNENIESNQPPYRQTIWHKIWEWKMKYNICNHIFTQTNILRTQRIKKNWQGSNKCNQCDHKSIKQAQTGSNTSFISFIESWTDMYIYPYVYIPIYG